MRTIKHGNFWKTPIQATGCAVALIAAGTLSATAGTLAVPASDETQPVLVQLADEAGGSQRINLSGKLRMLSQRVVANACYVQAGIALDDSGPALQATIDEFSLIINALRVGNEDLGIIGPEERRKTLAGLDKMEELWQPVAALAEQIGAGNGTQDELAEIAAQSGPLLDFAVRLVAQITGEYSNPGALLQRDALAIDIAGRQRMLAQRISKDVCLLGTGIDTAYAMEDLATTANLFDNSLTALRDGQPAAGLLPPSDGAVIADLAIVTADWATVQPKINDALGGEPVDDARLAIMFSLANTMTSHMNDVVVDYTEAAARGN